MPPVKETPVVRGGTTSQAHQYQLRLRPRSTLTASVLPPAAGRRRRGVSTSRAQAASPAPPLPPTTFADLGRPAATAAPKRLQALRTEAARAAAAAELAKRDRRAKSRLMQAVLQQRVRPSFDTFETEGAGIETAMAHIQALSRWAIDPRDGQLRARRLLRDAVLSLTPIEPKETIDQEVVEMTEATPSQVAPFAVVGGTDSVVSDGVDDGGGDCDGGRAEQSPNDTTEAAATTLSAPTTISEASSTPRRDSEERHVNTGELEEPDTDADPASSAVFSREMDADTAGTTIATSSPSAPCSVAGLPPLARKEEDCLMLPPPPPVASLDPEDLLALTQAIACSLPWLRRVDLNALTFPPHPARRVVEATSEALLTFVRQQRLVDLWLSPATEELLYPPWWVVLPSEEEGGEEGQSSSRLHEALQENRRRLQVAAAERRERMRRRRRPLQSERNGERQDDAAPGLRIAAVMNDDDEEGIGGDDDDEACSSARRASSSSAASAAAASNPAILVRHEEAEPEASGTPTSPPPSTRQLEHALAREEHLARVALLRRVYLPAVAVLAMQWRALLEPPVPREEQEGGAPHSSHRSSSAASDLLQESRPAQHVR